MIQNNKMNITNYMNEPMDCRKCMRIDIPRELLHWNDTGSYTDICEECFQHSKKNKEIYVKSSMELKREFELEEWYKEKDVELKIRNENEKLKELHKLAVFNKRQNDTDELIKEVTANKKFNNFKRLNSYAFRYGKLIYVCD